MIFPELDKIPWNVELELFREYYKINEFIDAFALAGQQDLDNLTPELILGGYKRGGNRCGY